MVSRILLSAGANYLSTLTERRDVSTFKREEEPKVKHHNYPKRDKEFNGDHTKGKHRDFKCFNCGDKTHIAANCLKPRLECSKCHRLGHESTDCKRPLPSKKAMQCDTGKNNTRKCYFTDCLINGKQFRGYIDTGCSIVALTEALQKVCKSI